MPASSPQIPAEAVRPGSLYKCPNVKVLMPAGEMVEVVVGEVYSPHRFWMIRRGADTLQALDALMDRMFEFYGSPIGGRYMVPNDFVTIGFPVVALYANDLNFYRAIVTNLEDLTTVRLFFVDYGTICRCDHSSLRLLHRAFLELPAQAIKASLCDVSPPGASRLWPRAASQRFLEMIQNKAFVAQVLVSEWLAAWEVVHGDTELDIGITNTPELSLTILLLESLAP
ncbi:tudor domain-containing protein 5-like [Penaeus indicus]|uniref:tudor domain-containing protein 5-like n=1 Tax=Penaeus indicus TaxID=29960 RepID=UPI00300D649A